MILKFLIFIYTKIQRVLYTIDLQVNCMTYLRKQAFMTIYLKIHFRKNFVYQHRPKLVEELAIDLASRLTKFNITMILIK